MLSPEKVLENRLKIHMTRHGSKTARWNMWSTALKTKCWLKSANGRTRCMDLCWSSEIRKTQLASSACYTDCLRAASVKRSWCLITWTHMCTILDIPPDEGSNSKTLVLCEEWGAQPMFDNLPGFCLFSFD